MTRKPPNPNTKLILESYCDYVGNQHVYQAPKFMSAAKNLANYGLAPDDLPALLTWSRTTWSGREGTDLVTAQLVYWKWIDAGSPGTKQELTKAQRIKAIATSTDPKYLGSTGARLRDDEITAIAQEDDHADQA